AGERTRSAGADIVERLRTRGSFYAASHAVTDVVEAIVQDRRKVFPLSVRYDLETEPDSLCVAVPVVVGADGPETPLQIELSEQEADALSACVDTLRTQTRQAGEILAARGRE
ncbi:MAG: hypothetical protein ACOC93_02530, partial [Planctomycetota bacterium]